MLRLTFGFVLLLAITASAHAGDKTPKLPKGIPLEEQPKDAKANKIVFIAGSNYFKPGEHEYIGGCAVLMDLVKQTPGIAPVLALDWPKNPETFMGAKAIVFFVDGADKHSMLKGDRMAQLQKLTDAGVGLVMLHQGVDIAKDHGDRMRAWTGAAWEKGHSQRAHWIDTYKTFPDHPVARGVTPFKIDDGYLFKLRFTPEMKGVTPILRTVNPKTPAAKLDDNAIVSWTFERKDGGRSFAFTGGHLHVSFAEEGYRRLLTNAILWTAKVEIPTGGAPVALTAAELDSYIENRATVK
ncbi:MAG: ThuA domain-containing protein [Bryobacteraceae bacterium]